MKKLIRPVDPPTRETMPGVEAPSSIARTGCVATRRADAGHATMVWAILAVISTWIALISPRIAAAQTGDHHPHNSGSTVSQSTSKTGKGPEHADPHASTASSNCGASAIIADGSVVSGDTTHTRNRFRPTCGGDSAHDEIYELQIAQPSHVVLSVQAGYDTVLSVLSQCGDRPLEVACNDDSGGTPQSRVEGDLQPGTYFVVVDGFNPQNIGRFTLSVSATPAAPPPVVIPPTVSVQSQGTSGSRAHDAADVAVGVGEFSVGICAACLGAAAHTHASWSSGTFAALMCALTLCGRRRKR